MKFLIDKVAHVSTGLTYMIPAKNYFRSSSRSVKAFEIDFKNPEAISRAFDQWSVKNVKMKRIPNNQVDIFHQQIIFSIKQITFSINKLTFCIKQLHLHQQIIIFNQFIGNFDSWMEKLIYYFSEEK